MLGVSSNLSILTLSANGLYSQLKAIGLLTRLLKRKKIHILPTITHFKDKDTRIMKIKDQKKIRQANGNHK